MFSSYSQKSSAHLVVTTVLHVSTNVIIDKPSMYALRAFVQLQCTAQILGEDSRRFQYEQALKEIEPPPA
jgi:hypothetical protein